jgi:hypothetical protein
MPVKPDGNLDVANFTDQLLQLGRDTDDAGAAQAKKELLMHYYNSGQMGTVGEAATKKLLVDLMAAPPYSSTPPPGF